MTKIMSDFPLFLLPSRARLRDRTRGRDPAHLTTGAAMRCLSCGAEMHGARVEQDLSTKVARYEHQTLECRGDDSFRGHPAELICANSISCNSVLAGGGSDAIRSDVSSSRSSGVRRWRGHSRARAQQPAMPVIGFLSSGSPETRARLGAAAFRQGLGETSYVEGQSDRIPLGREFLRLP
jgi:hypothetical protein